MNLPLPAPDNIKTSSDEEKAYIADRKMNLHRPAPDSTKKPLSEEEEVEAEYRANTKKTEFRRAESRKNVFQTILYTVVVLIGILLVTWVLHLVLPDQCQWLKPTQVDKIENLLLRTVTGSALTIFAQGYIKKNREFE